ncbi:hypothetical protein BLA28_09925 [Eisenbergiella tayi]|nr:hypothetical protein BLA28_09925 [Eisenbergiella tayi]
MTISFRRCHDSFQAWICPKTGTSGSFPAKLLPRLTCNRYLTATSPGDRNITASCRFALH